PRLTVCLCSCPFSVCPRDPPSCGCPRAPRCPHRRDPHHPACHRRHRLRLLLPLLFRTKQNQARLPCNVSPLLERVQEPPRTIHPLCALRSPPPKARVHNRPSCPYPSPLHRPRNPPCLQALLRECPPPYHR